jgi:hypothetical protein
VFANLFFYEFVVYVLLLVLLATAVAYLEHGATRQLLGVVVLVSAVSLTRSLFHPLWAIGFWVLLVLLRAVVAPSARPAARQVAAATGVLVLLLVVSGPSRT